jgi:hypothetical protein
MKKFKLTKSLALLTVTAMLFGLILLPVSAEENMIADLLPSKDVSKGNLTLQGCTMVENEDGSVTFTLTSPNASFKMVFAENFYKEGASGGSIYNDMPIDLSEPAYVVYDYGSADGVALSGTIAHYTRKDKAPNSTLADLYLVSMEGTDYAQYSKAKGDGYGIWDWGTYVTSDSKKIFDDNIHRFCDLESNLSGTVGASITFYAFYVSSTDQIEGLGSVRPTLNTDESEAESEDEDESEQDESEEDEDESEDESEEDEDNSEEADESDTESEDEGAKSADAQSETDESDGTKPIIYILIIAGALIVIGAIAYLFIRKKK